MTIAVGDRLPDATFMMIGTQGPEKKSSSEIFGGKKVVLFAVPGAFTPTCHLQHLPGFIENAEAMKAKGADTVACVSVNDPFVMDAWSDVAGARGKVTLLADSDASFTKAIGMDFDASGAGLGTRSKRYAMLVEDGVVKVLNVEGNPSEHVESTAEKLLEGM
ncbi:putative peroxiredoxin [Methyloligella halotolerans]|uniref:Glutathione-dependent peroxiredoxin n=1 Tax=Methyloligella halotolerans TaxID=1177755 RepID=A0A1E2RYL4_9HYPH|nr:peroxiredoxin [Methyloligella halotolerans]ODA67242.1 putative peroxiredoxin [Methyloligella halotolerans]